MFRPSLARVERVIVHKGLAALRLLLARAGDLQQYELRVKINATMNLSTLPASYARREEHPRKCAWRMLDEVLGNWGELDEGEGCDGFASCSLSMDASFMLSTTSRNCVAGYPRESRV